MIPVLIVPILNRPDLLDRLMGSIDHPLGRMVVIDNGDVVDPSIGGRHLTPYPVHVISTGWNIGVAASWSLGIKTTPLAPWWLITNHDITFGPGDLERLSSTVESRANAVYYLNGMAAFAVTPPVIHAVGWWDENIHPAYDEDLDWQRRARLIGTIEIEVGYTGEHEGSATIMADPVLRHRNGQTHGSNDAYYAAKWGGPKQGGETFSTPFNRGGHVGDWRLDINRLRDNAWPRPQE